MRIPPCTMIFTILLEIAFVHTVHGQEDYGTFMADPEESETLPDNSASESDSPFSKNVNRQDTSILSNESLTLSGNDGEYTPFTATSGENSAGPTKVAPEKSVTITDTLGGNLPLILEESGSPYLVISDVYVPSGKSVTIEPGTIILFKGFTTLHVEGRLSAEGTSDRPIIFTSEFDQTYNPLSELRANPYDWNGIYIHENGLGSSLAYCTVQYSVYGINSLTRYIKIDSVRFRDNGRADVSIEGKKHTISDAPYFYALTINDAKNDGVPVAILRDPLAKKRNLLRYGGFGLIAFGTTMGAWSFVQLNQDQDNLDALSEKKVIDENSPIVANFRRDWDKAYKARNGDRWIAVISLLCAVSGGSGVVWSFRF